MSKFVKIGFALGILLLGLSSVVVMLIADNRQISQPTSSNELIWLLAWVIGVLGIILQARLSGKPKLGYLAFSVAIPFLNFLLIPLINIALFKVTLVRVIKIKK